MRVRDCVVGCMVKCSDDALLYGSLHYKSAGHGVVDEG